MLEVKRCTETNTFPYCLIPLLNLCTRLSDLSSRGSSSAELGSTGAPWAKLPVVLVCVSLFSSLEWESSSWDDTFPKDSVSLETQTLTDACRHRCWEFKAKDTSLYLGLSKEPCPFKHWKIQVRWGIKYVLHASWNDLCILIDGNGKLKMWLNAAPKKTSRLLRVGIIKQISRLLLFWIYQCNLRTKTAFAKL